MLCGDGAFPHPSIEITPAQAQQTSFLENVDEDDDMNLREEGQPRIESWILFDLSTSNDCLISKRRDSPEEARRLLQCEGNIDR